MGNGQGLTFWGSVVVRPPLVGNDVKTDFLRFVAKLLETNNKTVYVWQTGRPELGIPGNLYISKLEVRAIGYY